MKRSQLYLAGLLLVQVLLILAFRSPFSGASTGLEPRALLPSLDAITPDRIEILGPDEDALELARSDGTWRVEALGGFPADGEKIEQLLANLAGIRVRRPVVTSDRYHASFKVTEEENEARIRVWDGADDDPQIDLIVGSSPNFRTSHVRLAGEDAVYEARGVSAHDIRPTDSTWVERDLIEADAARVVGLTLSNSAGHFELALRDGLWQPGPGSDDAAAELDQEAVGAFLRQVVDLRLTEGTGPLDEERHGFADPDATLVLRVQDEETGSGTATAPRELTVWVGARPADNESQRYVSRAGWGFTGTIWESSVRRLLEETIEDLAAS